MACVRHHIACLVMSLVTISPRESFRKKSMVFRQIPGDFKRARSSVKLILEKLCMYEVTKWSESFDLRAVQTRNKLFKEHEIQDDCLGNVHGLKTLFMASASHSIHFLLLQLEMQQSYGSLLVIMAGYEIRRIYFHINGTQFWDLKAP